MKNCLSIKNIENGIKNSRDKTCCWFTSISLNSQTKNNFNIGENYSENENHVINIWKYKKEESSSANLPNENKKRKSK